MPRLPLGARRRQRSRWVRRVRRIAILGAVIGLVAGTRDQLISRDQRAFDERYGSAPRSPGA